MIDIAIIGSGPAGLSAAINAVARGRKPVVYGRSMDTSFLYKAERVDNYLGMGGLSGEQMLKKFKEHATEMNVEIKEGRVLQIMPMGDYFAINFDNEIESARAVILTSGIVKGNKIQGEEEFLGRGVSYCATCDGMLYRGKEVAIVGETHEAKEDVEFLSKIAGKVHYIPAKGLEMPSSGNVFVHEGKALEVLGGDFVTALKTNEGIIDCQGVFFVKGTMPFDSLVAGIELDNGMVKVDKLMQTNIAGVFAAGDCTGWPFQLSKAVGEGLVAAQQADRYISGLELNG